MCFDLGDRSNAHRGWCTCFVDVGVVANVVDVEDMEDVVVAGAEASGTLIAADALPTA